MNLTIRVVFAFLLCGLGSAWMPLLANAPARCVSPQGQADYGVLLKNAQTAYEQGEYARAEKLATALTVLEEKRWEGHMILGAALNKQGKAGADEAFAAAKTRAPMDKHAGIDEVAKASRPSKPAELGGGGATSAPASAGDRMKLAVAKSISKQLDATTDAAKRPALLQELLKRTEVLPEASEPRRAVLFLRAMAALELDDGDMGWAIAKALRDANAAESADEAQMEILAQLERKGWNTEAKPEARAPSGCTKMDDAEAVDGFWSRVRHDATGIVLVLVPKGSFEMGSNDGNPDEKPVHTVQITKPFYLGETSVTVGQWRKFAATGYRTEGEQSGGGYTLKATGLYWEQTPDATWHNPFPNRKDFTNSDEHPVVQVSWNDAEAFCRQYGFTLPTEAQREYAARAGSTTKWWWGDNADGAAQHANLAASETKPECSYASAWDDGFRYLAPARAKESWRNGFGLYAMAGNVWEWCRDTYDESYYRASPAQDPCKEAGNGQRVLRGGSWNSIPALCRAAFRTRNGSVSRSGYVGFRVARTTAP